MFNVPHVHLYLHIPFCHRICPYCSFYKHTPGKTDLGAFVEAILDEARFAAKKKPPTSKNYLLWWRHTFHAFAYPPPATFHRPAHNS